MRLIRMQELPNLVGYRRSTVYQKIKDGTFPGPIKLGPRAVAWRSTDIDQWISERQAVAPSTQMPKGGASDGAHR